MSTSPALLLQHLRWQLLRNSVGLLWTHSVMRVLTIFVCSALIWGLLFGLSWRGFYLLKTHWDVPLDLRLIELVFDLLFFTLTVLLIFSTGIILYSSLFASPESHFLLATPMPDDHVFAYKFQGAVAFSSWAFVLLGSPILIAYGLEIGDGAPWYFYVTMPFFFLGFVLMPGSLGAIACLLLVNFFPRHRKQVLAGFVVLLVFSLSVWLYSWLRQAALDPVGSKTWFESLINELAILGGRFVPFHWISRGLKFAALRQPGQMFYYLTLVWSNGLFVYLVTLVLARRLYRRGYNRLASGGPLRKRYGGAWMDRLVGTMLFFLDPQTRLLIVKDVRTFRRDPAQWAQIVIFLALGCLYFLNMRRFYEQDLGRSFKNGISLLTLTATAFLMCAYTGRFIFPMLSLEGRKFWILGLLPLDRSRLLWGKFVFSATGCFCVGQFLVVFSNLMLGMPWVVALLHAFTVAILAVGLSGLSVGLGACFPNFRETDPSKIAVGFGGTLNLVACLLLLLTVVCLMAAPVHIFYGLNPDQTIHVYELPWWIGSSHLAGLVLGIVATVLPLRIGVRSLRAMEF